MTLTRRIGLGCLLGADKTGANTFRNLGTIVNGWKGSGAKAAVADCAIMSDVYKPKGKGQVDSGELTFQIAYDPSDATNTNTSQYLNSMLTQTGPPGTEANFQKTYPAVGAVNAVTETFLGWLTGMGEEVAVEKMIVRDITITISGPPGYTGE
jgi:tail tube protein